MPLSLQITKAYPHDVVTDCWSGRVIDDTSEFELFLRGPVWDRVADAAFEQDFSSDLESLATTGMGSDTLSTLLQTSQPPLDWEIGEAMAECLLQDEHGAHWPWNENRDRKTPKASLPGADIVGFVGEGEQTMFLFGEVKTSAHAENPPGVMSGRGGLAHQIDTLSDALAIHRTLMNWLYARCRNVPELKTRYDFAARRYLESGGTDFAVVGVMLRDTPAHVDDLRTRGIALDGRPGNPRMWLDAWYTPRPIADWVGIARPTP